MHSSVYQITTEKIIDGGLLDEDTLHQGDCSGLDYCSNIDDEERRERIENLVNNILPEGMFTLIDENTIRYNGGVEIWQEEWVKQIKEKMLACNCKQYTGMENALLSSRSDRKSA